MNSSRLKYKITLLPPTFVANSYGSKQDVHYTGGTSITIWAGKIDIGGNKTIQNAELFTSGILQFSVRYRVDFDETYRILNNSRYYEIVNIKEDRDTFHSDLIITANLLPI